MQHKRANHSDVAGCLTVLKASGCKTNSDPSSQSLAHSFKELGTVSLLLQ